MVYVCKCGSSVYPLCESVCEFVHTWVCVDCTPWTLLSASSWQCQKILSSPPHFSAVRGHNICTSLHCLQGLLTVLWEWGFYIHTHCSIQTSQLWEVDIFKLSRDLMGIQLFEHYMSPVLHEGRTQWGLEGLSTNTGKRCNISDVLVSSISRTG